MKYLFLFLCLFGCSNSVPHNEDWTPSVANMVATELDDLCQDTTFPYQVVLINGTSGGTLHCGLVSNTAAEDCIGIHIRIRRSVVVFGSSLVYITKRQSCPEKGKK